jgi:hypothetical protein
MNHYCQTSNSNGQQYNSNNNINHSSLKPEIGNVNNIARHNNMNHSVESQTVMSNNIASHNNMKYCYYTPKTVMVMFNRGVGHIVVAVILLTITV